MKTFTDATKIKTEKDDYSAAADTHAGLIVQQLTVQDRYGIVLCLLSAKEHHWNG